MTCKSKPTGPKELIKSTLKNIHVPETVLTWLSCQYNNLYIQFCKVEKTKIVFNSYAGKGYGDNPRYIAEEIIGQKLNWDLVWLTDGNTNSFPKEIRTVPYGSNAAMRELASAGMWIDNIRCSPYPPKKKKQIYLQTWHGGISFKLVEKAVEDKLSQFYIQAAMRDGDMSDGIISACKIQTDDFVENFWLNPNTEILSYGLPRNDLLFKEDMIQSKYQSIREHYGIDKNAKIVLYMPTFRDDLSLEGYKLEFEKILDQMHERFQQEFVMLIRLHPNVQDQAGFISYNSRIINATEYPDAQELYMASDYMITDYSSSAFDFCLLDRPVFLCMLDYEKYTKDRGLNDVFRKSPFPKAYTNDQFLEIIRNYSDEEYWSAFRKFKEEWQPYDDGHASARVVEWMKNKIQE